ncbi:MAG TPA: T9SS type A sorting domain-containing protein, partial [Bacteroidia bacterium]|nr:T9SS type A sorting domain-containing protein [Bacteroidia bacterium]
GIVSDNSFTSVQFTDIVVDNNGYVHVSFFGSKDSVNYAVWHSVSTDGGMTFSTPVKISDAHVPGFSGDQPNANIVGIDPTRFYPCQHLACDNSSGPNANNLYATWTANGTTSAATAGLDIYFSRSTDGGATWSSPVIINNDTATAADNFYSAITMNGNGVVLLSWYDRRTDPVNNKTTHYYFAYSSDGGQTFQGNQQITNTPTDFSTIGAQNNGFGIGEYTQIVATGAYAIPVWTDGRTNDGDCNIYCATIQWATFSGVAEPVAVNNHHISSVYPNPSSGSLSITLDFGTAQNANVTITDLSGRTVMNVCDGKTFEGKSRMDIDVSALAAGNYLLVLRTENGKETSKFTVAR